MIPITAMAVMLDEMMMMMMLVEPTGVVMVVGQEAPRPDGEKGYRQDGEGKRFLHGFHYLEANPLRQGCYGVNTLIAG